ncbi:MAG: hypothetical protein HKO70_04095 [Acidimicrobiia bacterium]|nr:hypothetical protein [Acidimicrobiia bacterium]
MSASAMAEFKFKVYIDKSSELGAETYKAIDMGRATYEWFGDSGGSLMQPCYRSSGTRQNPVVGVTCTGQMDTPTNSVVISNKDKTVVYGLFRADPDDHLIFKRAKANVPLPGGTRLIIGHKYYSADKKYYLVFQTDGNLCTYRSSDNRFVSGSYQSGAPLGGKKMYIQEDGNLCIYSGSDGFMWCTMKTGAGNELSIDGDGRIVVLSSSGAPVWTAE